MADNETKGGEVPRIFIPAVKSKTDGATVLGFIFALGFIGMALFMGGNLNSFLNVPSLLIVGGGTIAVTMMSFSIGDILSTPTVVARAITKKPLNNRTLLKTLLEISVIAKKHGVLALQSIEKDAGRNPTLKRALGYVSDGYTAPDIQRIMLGEIDAVKDRHEKSAELLYRAAEVAPAMGLIGTLIGLVQMLAQLDDPSIIGPSMAVALLTTLYGAFLGTVILSPIAAKLEKNSLEENAERRLILQAAISMAKHENPRRLEIVLNNSVAPTQRLNFFKGK